jgi:enediyne biosynthesis protein CalE5
MPSSEEITQQQRAHWSAAAAGWERSAEWFDRNSGAIAEWLCDAAAIRPGMHVLDVACGSGNPATTAAGRVGSEGRVIAVDLSPEMVAVTQRKAQRLGLTSVDAREMDAQALAFEDRTFDAVTCRFGLMFPPDPVRAAAEILRVLKPGARFATAVWASPAKNPYFTTIASVVAEFVPMPPLDLTAPGPFRLSPPGELERVLTAAGFRDVRVEPQPLTLTYESLEEAWRTQADLASPLRNALPTLAPETIARLKTRMFEALAPYMQGEAVKISAEPLCGSATRGF